MRAKQVAKKGSMDTNRDLSWMGGEGFSRSVREIFPHSDCMIYPNDIVVLIRPTFIEFYGQVSRLSFTI